jgi:hypothetical protein
VIIKKRIIASATVRNFLGRFDAGAQKDTVATTPCPEAASNL